MERKLLAGLGAAIMLLLAALAGSLYLQLDLPAPTGALAVGRTTLTAVDVNRAETLTTAEGDQREVPVVVWYPAQAGTGEPAPYFPNLAAVDDALAASGEVSAVEAWGLRYIRSVERLEAVPALGPWPVLLLSPGNGTNVEFYAALAEELASQGYVVIGLNHPYDVAAVELSNGRVAQFAENTGPLPPVERQALIAGRIAERAADAAFVLDQLELRQLAGSDALAAQMDLSRVGMLGHSLGGLAAAQACVADARLLACLNLDGLQAGGPFGAEPQSALPTQPFMFITKETELGPGVAQLWDGLTGAAYLKVIAGASHDSFTDGPLLLPGLLPFPNQADAITAEIRQYTLAFMDHSLKGQASALLEGAAYPAN
jgi:predicted dienelactone hydrolase